MLWEMEATVLKKIAAMKTALTAPSMEMVRRKERSRTRMKMKRKVKQVADNGLKILA